MTYLAIARKYRPQTFDQVIAQEPIVRTLKNAVEQNRVAHAYLFSGMRGVGKTTTARILAKSLNCEKGPTVTPCGACPSCVEIASSTSIDVLEVDAASTGRVEEVRVLLENARYFPARDPYKVFIIDEAHMLTKEACNALLKTLEEPPPRVIFVLATTEPHKIISTIHSRCQSFYFRSVSFEEILSVLARVAGEEKIKADSEALAVMARAAEGSLRDALSILDQAIAYCGAEINADKVRELLGVVSEDVLERLVEAVRAQSADAVLKLVDELVRDGHNLQHFSREVLRHIRNLLLVRVGGPAAALVEATGAERSHLEAVARAFSEEDLLRFFNTLLRTDGELRWSPQPRLHLELGLLKLVQAERLASVEEILAELSGNVPASRPTTATATTPPSAAQRSADALHPPKLEERRRTPAAGFQPRPGHHRLHQERRLHPLQVPRLLRRERRRLGARQGNPQPVVRSREPLPERDAGAQAVGRAGRHGLGSPGRAGEDFAACRRRRHGSCGNGAGASARRLPRSESRGPGTARALRRNTAHGV
jgi:DNA polymerase-3 subunit gamma/tau